MINPKAWLVDHRSALALEEDSDSARFPEAVARPRIGLIPVTTMERRPGATERALDL